MRLKIWLGFVLLTATSAWAVTGDNFDYHGYMRAGSGSNFDGADQTCHNLNGVPGNEFRLGNECGIYGEAYFQAYTPAASKPDGEFFRANFDLSYNPNGTNLTEPPNFDVFGAYVEAGRLDGIPETFWVGKRYYRDTDIHMDDFFYFADTSGDGAGIQDIPVGSGKLAIAIMREDASNTDTVSGVTVPLTTQDGRPRTLLLDVRLFHLKLNTSNELNFWGGVGTASGGTDPNAGVVYKNAQGEVLGIKEQFQNDAGYNRVAAIYGRGLMQGLNLSGYYGADPTQIEGDPYSNDAQRIRLVDEFVFQPTRNLAVAFAAIYETWNLSPAFESGRWISVGTRPVYFFSKHYSLAFEAGGANARLSGPAGTQPCTPLVRFTLAPQISPSSDFFSRPVLRAFVTDTTSVAEGASYGFQGEVWF